MTRSTFGAKKPTKADRKSALAQLLLHRIAMRSLDRLKPDDLVRWYGDLPEAYVREQYEAAVATAGLRAA